jgi:hypothetical protein
MMKIKQEIWSDADGNGVVVVELIAGEVPRPVVGFDTVAEAEEEYPNATVALDRTYTWDPY